MHNYSFIVLWSPEDDAFVALCPEFEGLSGFGPTQEEAIREAKIALEGFLEVIEESGDTAPRPRNLAEFSGQLRVRMPRWLHANLAHTAEIESVSLNTLIVSYLAQSVGQAEIGRATQAEIV